ncbi:hypothetical protein [Niveibacterium sp.]|uniref:hypothetical protein n=1 Tax=Niveibacterium sp. TaxID=2017444 RepID=UPI0035AE33B7
MYSTVIGAAPGNLSNPGQVLPFFAIDAAPLRMHRADCQEAAIDVSPIRDKALWFDRKT